MVTDWPCVHAAGLDIVTDGDSRFDLAVGGKSWFF